MLEGWLDWHRQTLLVKCAGLTAEQLKLRAVEPSSMSLLGLVRHMSEVERIWFRNRAIGLQTPPLYNSATNRDGDFDDVDAADAQADYAVFLEEIEATRAAIADVPLDHEFISKRHNVMSVRWVYLHMIEEYARHNGHADLLRERIDGRTGD
jgi:uncharacterized damage-inducible protein DinB